VLSFRLLANANTVQVTDVSQSTENLRYTRRVHFRTNQKMQVTMVRVHCAALITALLAKRSALGDVHLILNVSGRHETHFRAGDAQ